MIEYPSNLPCPLLEGNISNSSATFLRTSLEYQYDQRRVPRGQHTISFSIVLTKLQMDDFRQWYAGILNDGMNSFTANWDVEGNLTTKTFRFDTPYSVVSISDNLFKLKARIELRSNLYDPSEYYVKTNMTIDTTLAGDIRFNIYGGDVEIDDGSGVYTVHKAGVVTMTPVGQVKIHFYSGVYRIDFHENSDVIFKDRITAIDIVDATQLTSFEKICYYMQKLSSFNATNTQNVTVFTQAWQNCRDLTVFPVIDTSKGTEFTSTWYGCESLTSFPSLDFSKATSLSSTWRSCSALESVGYMDTSSLTYSPYTFAYCDKLLCISAINTLLSTNTTNMFVGCNVLLHPNSAEESAILSGDNWVNPNPCP